MLRTYENCEKIRCKIGLGTVFFRNLGKEPGLRQQGHPDSGPKRVSSFKATFGKMIGTYSTTARWVKICTMGLDKLTDISLAFIYRT